MKKLPKEIMDIEMRIGMASCLETDVRPTPGALRPMYWAKHGRITPYVVMSYKTVTFWDEEGIPHDYRLNFNTFWSVFNAQERRRHGVDYEQVILTDHKEKDFPSANQFAFIIDGDIWLSERMKVAKKSTKKG